MKDHTMHDNSNRILPSINDMKFVEFAGSPRGVLRTHMAQLNAKFVKFLA
jgi:hypothetical protein